MYKCPLSNYIGVIIGLQLITSSIHAMPCIVQVKQQNCSIAILLIRDSRKSRKHGSRVIRVFRHLPCFASFAVFLTIAVFAVFLHSFGFLGDFAQFES